MSTTEEKIRALTAGQVAEAVQAFGLALATEQNDRVVEDDEVREVLRAVQTSGPADELRRQVLDRPNDPAQFDRWGRSLLRFAAADPDLAPHAEKAIDAAARSGAKFIGLSSLIVIGAVLVLLKYRPKSVRVRSDEKGTAVQVDWEENDVRAVSDLVKAAGS